MPITGDLGASNYLKSQVADSLLSQNSSASEKIVNDSIYSAIEKNRLIIDQSRTNQEDLQKFISNPWPQISPNSQFSERRGFLPTQLLQPSLQTKGDQFNASAGSSNINVIKNEYFDYKFKDWNGQILTDEPQFPKNKISTEDRFKSSNKLPKSKSELFNSPHSMRDVPLIFNDVRTDNFKFGLQSINNLTPIENPANGSSTLRKDLFTGTPWEQNDPIFYGFDIIIDSVSSPLLNGAIDDFINNYSSINEISSKRRVYEEFKNQFVKFFRTNASVKVDTSQLAITLSDANINLESPSQLKNQQRGKAYLAYYIKSINGLNLLIEKNKGQAYSWAPKYKEDMIEIKMVEDVTLSLSTLAHLYKLLYWSRPNGKHLIPENLLRFNCQIVISECRNMNRVRKDVATGNIEVLKDNLSRWVYNLRECQFYFDKMPIPDEIDMSSEPKEFESQAISFDFKYSTTNLERFVPDGKGWGKYVSYNAGAIWKIGNAGSRDSRKTGSGGGESSVPTAFVDGVKTNDNGVSVPYVISVYGDKSRVERTVSSGSSLDIFKSQSEKNSSVQSELNNDISKEEANSNKKQGQNIVDFLRSSEFKKVKDFVLDVSGINQRSLITVATSTLNSPFFDKMGNLPNNNPITQGTAGLINSTINKLYNSVPKPLGDVSQVPLQKALFDELNKNRDTIMKNNLNGSNPQSNITYAKGYTPPLKGSFNLNHGSDPSGNLYVIKNQVGNFAGGPLTDQIFSQINKNK